MHKAKIGGSEIKKLLLEIVGELKGAGPGFQAGSVLQKAEKRLSIPYNDNETQQAVLTIWQELFRSGYLAWGLDLSNPNPPFFHVTENGRRILRHLSRDPGNPDGYIEYIKSKAVVSPVTYSYLMEAIETYNFGAHKAAAVMVGCAVENMMLELRDCVINKLNTLGRPCPENLKTWMPKKIFLGLETFFEKEKKNMPYELFESSRANWAAFTQQIRTIRNDAGHPVNIERITEENVHASLLIFPELAKLSNQLQEWINLSLK